MLNIISRDLGLSKEVSSGLDRRLSGMEQSLWETNRAISSHTNTIIGFLQARVQLPLIDRRSSMAWRAYGGFLATTIEDNNLQISRRADYAETLHTSTKTLSQGNEFEDRPERSTGLVQVFPQQIVSSEPVGRFEKSQSFFPETYTMDSQLPNSLFVTCSYEEMSSDCSRTNFYRLFYLKSPRQWRRISISINIHQSSIYWPATKVSQHEFRTKDAVFLVGPGSIPYSLQNQIQDFLSEAEDLHEDAHIEFSLSNQLNLQRQYHKARLPSISTYTESSNASSEILAFLDDLGCPRYFENEVNQIAPLEPPTRFAACINGTLVEETKFARALPSYEFLYNIQLLRCLSDISGIAKFAGITVDNSGNYLKSYLVEMPKTKCSLLLDRATQTQYHSWKHHENWARQLIQRISQVHSKGFVVGTLWYQRPAILIDSFDCLYFWRFEATIQVSDVPGALYPPEFRHYRSLSNQSINEAECPKVTPKFDIFHLGMILWILAESFSSRVSTSRLRERFSTLSGPYYSDSLVDTIALPRLANSIPQYYKDVVDACRAENPNERPPARRLLELFPPTNNSESCRIGYAKPESMDVGSLRACVAKTVTCDLCGKGIRMLFFHCNICSKGDYDICPKCYDAGLHCLEQDHLLVELENRGSCPVARRYHSRVKSSGKRDVIEL